jgi:hypothetical protein
MSRKLVTDRDYAVPTAPGVSRASWRCVVPDAHFCSTRRGRRCGTWTHRIVGAHSKLLRSLRKIEPVFQLKIAPLPGNTKSFVATVT